MSQHKKAVGAVLSQHGVAFRVWAPFADSVSVSGSFNDWGEAPLISEADGYWSGTVKEADAGQEYKYVIYNAGQRLLRNDPRALYFTTASGNSVIASQAFDWSDDDFEPIPFNKQIIYELHVGTFCRQDPAVPGTFYDLIRKLDYLATLGINTIELLPIFTMRLDRGWGYAIDYIYSVESLYGGRHALLSFIKEAHRRGIGVILDVVFNHFGPDTTMDLWAFDGWQIDGKGGIYFYNDWRSETPWGSIRPDFGRIEVHDYITDNVAMWLKDCRVDGLRVDSTIFIRNVEGKNNDPEHDLPEGWQLLKDISAMAKKIKPSSLVIAEDVADNEYITKSLADGGAGFDAQWELSFPWAFRQALKSQDPDKIEWNALIDELGRGYNGDPWQRVTFIDSHDTAANGGCRFNETIAPHKSAERFARNQTLIAMAILMTTPGIPMLFQGIEQMTGGSFNDWQAIDWTKTDRYQGIQSALSHLCGLRLDSYQNSSGLLGAGLRIIKQDEQNKVLAYHRWQQGGPGDDVVVVCNLGHADHETYQLEFPSDGKWHVRFNSTWTGYDKEAKDALVEGPVVEGGVANIRLPGGSALIFSQDPNEG